MATFAVAGTLALAASAHGGIPRAFSISFAPDDPKQILLRSDVWGLMRTTDDGQSWKWTCAEVYGGNSLSAEHRVSILGARGRVLVASQFNGLQITDDYCSWHANPAFDGQVVEEIVAMKLPGATPAVDGGVFATGLDKPLDAGRPDAGQGVDAGRPKALDAGKARSDASLGPITDAGATGGAGTEMLIITATGHGDAGISGGIWHSLDNGDKWSRVGSSLPQHFFGASVLRAPSNRNTIYAAGGVPNDPTTGMIERSDDDGATWHESTFAIQPQDNDCTVRIVLVDPTRPNIAVVWLDLPEGLGVNAPDAIYATTDSGATWKPLFQSTGDLPGLALSPDGKTLLIAGPIDGVQSANFDDALARGQAAFTRVFSGAVWALNWVADGTANGRLYAGNDNFAARGIPAYTLGVSTDEGHSFSPLMTICDVTYPACSPNSMMSQACSILWNDPTALPYYAGFEKEFTQGDRCSLDGGLPDAGTAPKATKKSSGCSCSLPFRSAAPHDAGAPLLFAAGALAITRRRRRSRIS